MKFLIALYLCLSLFMQSGHAQDETPTKPPSTPDTLTSATDKVLALETTTPPPTETAVDTTTTPVSEPSTEPTTSTTVSVETTSTVSEPSTSITSANQTAPKFVEKLSDQIRSILKHFQDPEPSGFPRQKVLMDPMTAPNTTTDLGIMTGNFYNITIHGLSNFTVEAVNLLLDQMEVYVMIRMKRILVHGNCTMNSMLMTSKGPFSMVLTNVTAEGTVYIVADSEGKLHANKSITELAYQDLSVLVNSNTSSILQTILNGAGMALLASIKPYILDHIDQHLTNEVNKQLETTPKIPAISNMSPVDLVILEGRKFIRKMYEPYTIENVIHHDSDFLIVNIGPVTIHGLSKFARVGNVTLQMRENVVQLGIRLITGRIRGKCKWFYDFGKSGLTRNGESWFSIEHVQFEAKLNQSINLKKTPVLDDLQLELGPIIVKMDDGSHFDYIIERVIKALPDLLKHLIIDALEEPIKYRVQKDVLDKINVEKLVEDNLSLIETVFVY